MRSYQVLRKGTAQVAVPAGDGSPAESVTVEVWFPVGEFTQNGDEQACKAAAAADLAAGALADNPAPEYVAVGDRSFHRHVLAIRHEPQISIAR